MKFFTPMFLTVFFFVSGYLSKEGQTFTKVFEQRTRTLLLPVLSLGTLMIIMSHILSFKSEVLSWKDGFVGLLAQNGENTILWFVAALYVYSIVFYWVERCCKNVNTLLLVGVGLFVANVISSHWLRPPALPWHINSVGFACFYMALGKWYKHHEEKFDSYCNIKTIGILLTLYVVMIGIGDLHISYSGSKYAIDAIVVTVIGVTLCVQIAKRWLNNSRFLIFVGANTLFYFAFHGKVYSLLQTIIGKVLPMVGVERGTTIDIVLGVTVMLADALILILPAMLVNRYAAWLLGKGFKIFRIDK